MTPSMEKLLKDHPNLRILTAEEQERRDAVLMRCARLSRDGLRVGLPPVVAGWAS